MSDIQSIGAVLILLPMLAMLILLAFAMVQLAYAVRLQRVAKASQPNAYMRNRVRHNLR